MAGALIPSPLPIREVSDDLINRITQIRLKTTTLVNYYIYPGPTPSEIKAYDPRLEILKSRVTALSKISQERLALLVDDSDALIASFLSQIVDQLLNAVHGVDEIFINHYDRELEHRKPYNTIYETLLFRERQLQEVTQLQMTNPRRMRPEDMQPNEPGNICRGAIQMINNRDHGRISFVNKRDLLDENRVRLRAYGGAFLWWECQQCTYKLRFHVTDSATSNIHKTDEIRDHRGVDAEYRSSFLAKCHLFQAKHSKASRASISGVARYCCLFCFGTGKDISRGDYVFSNGRDLAIHIAENHKKNLPPSLMLQKFNVAVKGKAAERVRRWDINLK